MNTVDILITAINAYGEKKMYTIEQFLDYRRSLDVLRNELKLCMHYKTTTIGFMQEGERFLGIIDREHEICNKTIGELTK